MKYTKLTADIEKAVDTVMSGNTQGIDARAVAKLANLQISAWREKRCFHQARDEKPPEGEMDS